MQTALVIGASGGDRVGGGGCACGTRRRRHRSVARRRRLDVTDEASLAAQLGALDGPFDLIFVATGALEIAGYRPEKTLRQITAQGLADQFALTRSDRR